ncbi:MAG: type II toxin-antitoxin system RelE/ParE family toxin [Caldilineaceae bacterium]
MIKSFKDRETEKIFRREFSRRLPQTLQRSALRRLTFLHGARQVTDLLAPPSNQLEQLSGNRAGQYSIRINDQWRICFEWLDGDAYNVEIVDYH